MTKKLFSKDDITRISTNLQALPPLEPNLSLKDLINSLSNDINNLRENGYSFESIITMLEKDGVKISITTLKNYLSHHSKQTMPRTSKKANAAMKGIRSEHANDYLNNKTNQNLNNEIDEKNI
jgi:hypothetical protein